MPDHAHIPFKAYATPACLAQGDIIALYAGNVEPTYTATVEHVIIHSECQVTVVTDDGRFDVDPDSLIWVADWAPMASLIPDL